MLLTVSKPSIAGDYWQNRCLFGRLPNSSELLFTSDTIDMIQIACYNLSTSYRNEQKEVANKEYQEAKEKALVSENFHLTVQLPKSMLTLQYRKHRNANKS